MPSRVRVDREPIFKMLDETEGNIPETARRLGLHVNTIRHISRVRKGLCARCERPSQPGLTKCKNCAQWERKRIADSRARSRKLGKCSMCPKKLRKGSTLYCEEHYQQTFKRQRVFRILDRHGPEALEFLNATEDRCQACGVTRAEKRIDLHHIDGDHGNDHPTNFAVICVDCHWIAHRLLLSRDRKALISWFEKTYPAHVLR